MAFAVAAVAETAYALALNRSATNIDFSEHRLFFCDADPSLVDWMPSCYNGWTVPDALRVLQAKGIYRECCWPYNIYSDGYSCHAPTWVGCSGCKGPVPGKWIQLPEEGGLRVPNKTLAKEIVREAGSAIACFRLYDDMLR